MVLLWFGPFIFESVEFLETLYFNILTIVITVTAV